MPARSSTAIPEIRSFSRPASARLGALDRLRIALRRIDHRRFWLLVLIGLIGAVAFGSIVQSRAVVAGFGTLRPVAIANNDLVAGQRIGPADLRWEDWPLEIAAMYPTDVEGALVRSPVAEGEPVDRLAIFDAGAAMDPDERAVTVPLPLAPPPVQTGDIVELIGLTAGFSLGDRQTIDTRSLGQGRIMAVEETGITVAVQPNQVLGIVETIAIGSIEIVMTPFRS